MKTYRLQGAQLLCAGLILVSSVLLSANGLQAQTSESDAPLSGQAQLITLEKTFDTIETQNFSVLIQNELVVSALETANRARAGVLPRVDLSGRQVRTRGSGAGVVGSSVRNSFNTKLSATIPLVDAKAITDSRVGKFNYEISQLDTKSTVQDILQIAGSAYFTHLRNLARREVIEANIARDKVLFELANNQFKAGVATPIDVTRAEVQLATDEKDMLQQDTAVIQSELEIKRLLAMNLDTTIILERMDPNETALNISAEGMSTVLGNRPEYEKAQRTLERNQYARKMAPWEQAPTVDLIGEYGVADETPFNGNLQDEWLIGVAFTMPIFDGWNIRSNKLQADSLVRQQQYVVKQLEDQLGADYRLSLQDVRSRFQQIAISRKRVSLSEKELDLARTRFQQGVADNRDVVEAQANLAFAHDGLVESIYQYNLSRLALARVRGNVRLILVN
ncbi:MAG: TolC family protein [Verrucomicrobiota bacterium]|nr:TolC family protein [Verrucomicrobiota bacterium]